MTLPSATLYPEQPVLQMDSQIKMCSTCKTPQPLTNFGKDTNRHDGLCYRCKSCAKIYAEKLKEKHALDFSTEKKKTCFLCNTQKFLDDFYKHDSCLYGKSNICKTCTSAIYKAKWAKQPRPPELNRRKNKEWRDANKGYCQDKSKTKNFTYYGVTREWYEKTYLDQNGNCAICGIPDKESGRKRMSIDHNHKCCPTGRGCQKCRRGLLCTKCNTRLGVLELGEWVKQEKFYLNKYSSKDEQDDGQGSLFGL